MSNVLQLLESPWARAGLILVITAIVGWVVDVIFRRVLGRLAQQTRTKMDDQVIAGLRAPVFVTVAALGLVAALRALELGPGIRSASVGLVKTIVILSWARSAMKTSRATLGLFADRPGASRLVQTRTLPFFEIVFKVLVFVASVYLVLVAWRIDVSGWLASAGIVGIALGFAAKDTLANLFAGIFILADAPYEIGDFIVLDDGTRGRVTAIGVRSTRVLTRDEVEVTVPNALIANGKIVNESGGPTARVRLRIPTTVAYGSDPAQVRTTLLACATESDFVSPVPAPIVRFAAMGDSALNFDLHVWIAHPSKREAAVDALNTSVYEALNRAGIGIPFPQADIWVRQLPTSG